MGTNQKSERWIVVPRWDEFQHPDALRTGTIPWLKTFTRLLSDSSYLDLNAGERAVLHGIWLEYARARGQLTVDTGSLTRRLSLRVTRQHLEALNHVGFIEFAASRPASMIASRPASTDKTRLERKSSSTSKERAREAPPAPDSHAAHEAARAARLPWQCPACPTVHERSRDLLREHLENVHWLEGDQLERALTAADPGATLPT